MSRNLESHTDRIDSLSLLLSDPAAYAAALALPLADTPYATTRLRLPDLAVQITAVVRFLQSDGLGGMEVTTREELFATGLIRHSSLEQATRSANETCSLEVFSPWTLLEGEGSDACLMGPKYGMARGAALKSWLEDYGLAASVVNLDDGLETPEHAAHAHSAVDALVDTPTWGFDGALPDCPEPGKPFGPQIRALAKKWGIDLLWASGAVFVIRDAGTHLSDRGTVYKNAHSTQIGADGGRVTYTEGATAAGATNTRVATANDADGNPLTALAGGVPSLSLPSPLLLPALIRDTSSATAAGLAESLAAKDEEQGRETRARFSLTTPPNRYTNAPLTEDEPWRWTPGDTVAMVDEGGSRNFVLESVKVGITDARTLTATLGFVEAG
jgi:hypothetical protein